MNNYQLPNNCLCINGYRRSVIYDIQNLSFHYIPNSLAWLLNNDHNFTKDDWIAICGVENKETIISYFNFLLNRGLLICMPSHIKIDALQFYPILKRFSNSIISRTNCDIDDAICQLLLNENIHFLNLIIKDICERQDVFNLLVKLKEFKAIELYITTNLDEDDLMEFTEEFVNVKSIFVFNSNVERVIKSRHPELGSVYFIHSKIQDLSCGNICKEYFCVNSVMLNSVKSVNTCLFGKLCVDENNSVSNCLFSTEKYGNIYDINIDVLLFNESFTHLWRVLKDDVDVCKECEYRYMCTDCRVFIKDSENIYSQPSKCTYNPYIAKCTYNPYIAKWAGEDGYVSVDECGSYSRESGFVVDAEKVEALNQRVMA